MSSADHAIKQQSLFSRILGKDDEVISKEMKRQNKMFKDIGPLTDFLIMLRHSLTLHSKLMKVKEPAAEHCHFALAPNCSSSRSNNHPQCHAVGASSTKFKSPPLVFSRRVVALLP